MQVVSAALIKGKKVLLRLDIDVPLGKGESGKGEGERVVLDDFRLVAGMPTLELCLENASKVIIMGHIGRPSFAQATAGKPNGEKDEALTVAPIYDWLVSHGFGDELDSGKLKLLENLRFEKGEEEANIYYAQQLASLGNFYINEAFASHHPAASTTVLPLYLPHCAGLQFAKEVETLTKVREASRSHLVAIIGGVKVEDKLPAVLAMAKIADYVLVGGKIARELSAVSYQSSDNILVADLTEDGEDITEDTVAKWAPIISSSASVLWNGPLGKIEREGLPAGKAGGRGKGEEEMGSAKGTYDVAKMIIESDAESIIGGGDTIGFLGEVGLLDDFEQKGFVSTGGGAMLKFLEKGTLPTIEALK